MKTCTYCNPGLLSKPKPTIRVKSASSCEKRRKLTELGAIIKGTSYPGVESVFRAKGASVIKKITRPGPIEREMKLRELAKMIRG
jgi:hypothetical protein